jgi:hypothetical protein
MGKKTAGQPLMLAETAVFSETENCHCFQCIWATKKSHNNLKFLQKKKYF